jgi:tRNA nucleotidyltransferase/poly(A) polymerase
MRDEGTYKMSHYAVPNSTQIAKLLVYVEPLTQLFTLHAVPWRIVGGAVRDAVCGVIAREIDVEVVHTDLTHVYAWIHDKFPQALIVGHEKPIIRRKRLHDNWVDISVTATG